MVLPSNSGSSARRLAATTAAPELIPARIPSFPSGGGHLDGFVAAHLFDAVQQAQVQVARNEAGAYALDLVRTRFDLFTGQLLADDGDSLGSTATETMALPLVCLM